MLSTRITVSPGAFVVSTLPFFVHTYRYPFTLAIGFVIQRSFFTRCVRFSLMKIDSERRNRRFSSHWSLIHLRANFTMIGGTFPSFARNLCMLQFPVCLERGDPIFGLGFVLLPPSLPSLPLVIHEFPDYICANTAVRYRQPTAGP